MVHYEKDVVMIGDEFFGNENLSNIDNIDFNNEKKSFKDNKKRDKIYIKSDKWVVFYDIRDPKRLRKVAKIVEQYGKRVQKSVFEIIAPFDVIKRLQLRIEKVIHVQDYVLYLSICESDWQKQQKFGKGAVSYKDESFIIL